MTLQNAIRMMNATVSISMSSDAALAGEITARQAAALVDDPTLAVKLAITPATGVDGNLPLRPISAMLELARGTVLNESPDIAAFSRRWPVLRYLGVFASNAARELHLDGAALRFTGPNQRRVLSEELGIGFGILVAKHWCRARNPAVGPITAIDVDKALHNGTMPTLQLAGRRQPDYLLSYPDRVNAGAMVYELLETKGTVSMSTAKSQLGRAVTQLAGLTVAGQPLTGIAVSTISTAHGLLVLAVDPDEPPITWKPKNSALEHWRFAETRPRKEVSRLDVSAEELFASATNVDNAALAAYSGQEATARRWLPNLVGSAAEFGRVQRTNDLGTFVGAEVLVAIPGTTTRLRIYQGAEKDIVDGLDALDASAVQEARQAFRRIDESKFEESADAMSDSASATAVSSDGSLLQISAE